MARNWFQKCGVENETGDNPEDNYLPKGGDDPAQPDTPCKYPAEFSDSAFIFGAARDYIREMGAPEPFNRLFDLANLSMPALPQKSSASCQQLSVSYSLAGSYGA